jgi:hypothetical protein
MLLLLSERNGRRRDWFYGTLEFPASTPNGLGFYF